MDKPKRLSKDELAKLNDGDLAKYAADHQIDLAGGQSRDDVMAAIELHHEAAEKAAANDSRNQQGKRSTSAALSIEQIEAVREVWTAFGRVITQPMLSSGSFSLPKADRKAARDHGVPDGSYRVIGADWILTFEKGRFVEAYRGGPTTEPDSYISVPAPEHPVPG